MINNTEGFKRSTARLNRVGRWNEFLNTNLNINQISAVPSGVVDIDNIYSNYVNCPSPSELVPNSVITMANAFRNSTFNVTPTIVVAQNSQYAYADTNFIAVPERTIPYIIKGNPSDLSHIFENCVGSENETYSDLLGGDSPNLNCYAACKSSERVFMGIPGVADNISELYYNTSPPDDGYILSLGTYNWNDASRAFAGMNSQIVFEHSTISCNNGSHMFDNCSTSTIRNTPISCNDCSGMFMNTRGIRMENAIFRNCNNMANMFSCVVGTVPSFEIIVDGNCNTQHMFDDFTFNHCFGTSITFVNSNANFSRMFANNCHVDGGDPISVSGCSGDCSYMFANTNSDVSVIAVNTVTNASHMFENCLTAAFEFRNYLNSCNDASYMFANTTGILNGDATDFRNMFKNIVNASHMFENYHGTFEHDMEYFSNVIDGSYMFANIKNANVIERMSGVEFPRLKNMSHMFEGMPTAEGLYVDLSECWHCVDLSYAYANCNLTNCYLYDYSEPTLVGNTSHMFYNTTFPNQSFCDLNFDLVNVWDASYMFAESKKLNTCTWNCPNVHLINNASHMFYNCSFDDEPEHNVNRFIPYGENKNLSSMFERTNFPSVHDLGINLGRLDYYYAKNSNLSNMFANVNIGRWVSDLSLVLDKFTGSDLSNMYRGCNLSTFCLELSYGLSVENFMANANINLSNLLTDIRLSYAFDVRTKNIFKLFPDGSLSNVVWGNSEGIVGEIGDIHEFANILSKKMIVNDGETINIPVSGCTEAFILPAYNNIGNVRFVSHY